MAEALQREAVLRAERQHDRVVIGGGLKLEVEAPADALSHGQTEGPVHAAAEGRVNHELHAASVVEEALDREARAVLESFLGQLGVASSPFAREYMEILETRTRRLKARPASDG